jgi:tRNA-dihydrouridine synthase B
VTITSRFPFEPALVLAPMEGVTTASIRALIASYGPVGLVCTEFVRVAGDSVSKRHLTQQVRKAPGVALSVQIMGNDAALMAEAAGVMAQAGADVIDVNLGCPSKTAARKGVGAALLKDRVALARLLAAMRGAVPGLFSAKLRAGFEHSEDALDNARVVERSGADFLAVHPRRRVDYFQGTADWRIIRLLRRELSIPVIGNGDVWYAADALRMLDETGCHGVMIGRPALRNPWIFRQIAELSAGVAPFTPSGADVVAHVERLHAAMASGFDGPPARLAGPLKEHLVFLCRSLPRRAEVSRGLLRVNTPALLLEAAAELFAPLAADQLDLDAHGRHALERSGSAVVSGVSSGVPAQYSGGPYSDSRNST